MAEKDARPVSVITSCLFACVAIVCLTAIVITVLIKTG